MSNGFIQVGKKIKIEVNMEPSFLFIKGDIQQITQDEILLKIDTKYGQKNPQKVQCTIVDESKSKVCIFDSVIRSVNKDELILAYPKEEDIRIIQRREYIRVTLDKEISCYLIGINDRKVESDKMFPARIKDISGGGVMINSSLSLPIGTILVFEIDLDGNRFLLTIRVIRNTVNEEDQTRNLGCQFMAIDEADRQKIIAYCNKEQAILKRKQKMMMD